MKKNVVFLLMSVVLVMAGCGNLNTTVEKENEQKTESPVIEESLDEENKESEDVMVEDQEEVDSAEVSGEVPENMETMIAPMDAIMMCAVERGFQYDVGEPEAFWKLMYYCIGNYGSEHQLAKVENGVLQLDRRAVQEFAAAMFADYNDLVDIPEDLNDSIVYNEDMDAYEFSLGDRGLSQSEISACEKNEDGSYTVVARLYDVTDGSTIYAAKFNLVENQYASGIENPLFMYSVKTAEEFVVE